MQPTRERYGALWPTNLDSLAIELACIRRGGTWTSKAGKSCGKGLFHHYRAAQSLLWPEDDHHRWSDLILEEILTNRITAILGPKDSGKTHGASKFGLVDYYAFPENTLILISSTDLRGLEMRVWGDLKSLHEDGKRRFPMIPGHVLDSKHAICTDNLDEDQVRDMRKGIICIPCLSSTGTFVGLGRYVGLKQERRRLISDECFPAGTMVDTPTGARPIESIEPGDVVISASGLNRVRAISQRIATELVTLSTRDGRKIQCTPNHPLFTQKGWIRACELGQSHYIMSPHETMRLLRQQTRSETQNVLQQCLLSELQVDACMAEEIQRGVDFRSCQKSRLGFSPIGFNDSQESYGQSRDEKESFDHVEENGVDASCSRGKRDWSDQSGEVAFGNVSPARQEQLSSQDGQSGRERLSYALQSGRCIAGMEIGYRSGRGFAYRNQEGAGREKIQSSNGSWVDRVQIQKPTNLGRYSECEGGIEVFNLEVASHPSYSVNGLAVHNCQFMKESFLDAMANLNSGDFKGVFLGNPIGQDDPLDKVAEPKEGWTSLPEPDKTIVWKNRWLEGKTINLVGTDSPNFDAATRDQYSYLINQKSIDNTVAFYGTDSLQYYSQCKGVRKSGLNAHRVITRELCEQFHAFDPVVWKGGALTKIAACDAAYGSIGGDRCVGGHIEYGEDIDGHIVVAVHPPVIVPVKVSRSERPEDQIAQWAMEYCEGNEIPPENFFFDATGRGSLGTSLARIWSAQTQPVEFGGIPTNRPVSLDLFIRDPRTGERRLKLCHEHYSKFVTELWWSVRYVVESDQMRQLPEDVAREGYLREWKLTRSDKIEIESKKEMKTRMNRSPDFFDWLATAVEGARRRGFKISKLANDNGPSANLEWLEALAKRNRRLIHKNDLSYNC